MKKIAILGFGREGKAVFKFIKRSKTADEIWILDKNSKIETPSGVKTQLGKNYLTNLDSFDIVFRSPGAPYNLSEIQKAVKKGVKFSSATKLFFEKCPAKIIGITGTKGKGTTSTLIYKILRAAGRNAFLVGNIGKPCLDILSAFAKATADKPKLNKNSIVVFELSSFQLQDLRKSPDIAVILDIFPDHLDAHKTLKEYLEAKTNIVRYQKPKDKVFYFADNLYSRKIARLASLASIPSRSGRAKRAAKSGAEKIPVFNKPSDLFAAGQLKIKGPHNFKNTLMAAAVTKNLDIDPQIIKKTILNFRGLEYRLKFVKKINGVSIYNDSASTNPRSAAAAIQSFIEPQILIAGGKDKNLNFEPLAKALKSSSVKKVFLFGENKNKIKTKINKIVPTEICPDLKNALEKAFKIAYNGEVIVFSPASASFDMFKDYKNRGKVFKKLVSKLKK